MITPSSTTLVFLIDNLSDRERLANALPVDATVVYLDSRTNALDQMAGYVAMLPAGSVGAIHLVSHGSSASLSLGSLTLDDVNLRDHASTLGKIGEALTADGDLLLYGCNVAAGEAGQAFIAALAKATGADVAASDDLTGNTAQGGDSALEAFTGSVESAVLKLDAMDGVLSESAIVGTEGGDLLIGKGGDDILDGLGGDDCLGGGDGNDTLYGGDGADGIGGENGDDTIYGGDGNDLINGNDGNDWVYGGHGDDGILDDSGDDHLFGEEGDDLIEGGPGDDVAFGGPDEDMFMGGEGNDVLYGDDGDDSLHGDAGDDRLDGGSGDDYLNGGAGNDVLYGGSGNNRLLGKDGFDTAIINATRGDCVLSWHYGALYVTRGNETDRLYDIERVQYSDVSIAYDLDGNAGLAMKFIATIAPQLLGELGIRGQILSLLDGGESMLSLCQKAIDLHLVPGSNADLASTLHKNVLNSQPTAASTQALVGYIENHGQADFVATVAGLGLNVDLVGLQQAGVEYV